VTADLSDVKDDDLASLFGAPLGWARDALCPEYPAVDFFPGAGVSPEPAQRICGRCLVRQECADFAMAEKIAVGVWGGLSARERRKVRATEREAA
jgi:WhiB family transcriptional regulator, redox-sensing transcriptional regulator